VRVSPARPGLHSPSLTSPAPVLIPSAPAVELAPLGGASETSGRHTPLCRHASNGPLESPGRPDGGLDKGSSAGVPLAHDTQTL